MLILAKEIAVGDYSPEFGHISAVEPKGKKQLKLTYVNGKTQYVQLESELEIVQGGWKETDHSNDPDGPIHQRTR